MQLFWPSTYFPEPEVKPGGQTMHSPLASGRRVANGWPELVNMPINLPRPGVAGTLHMFQTVTSSTKALAP